AAARGTLPLAGRGTAARSGPAAAADRESKADGQGPGVAGDRPAARRPGSVVGGRPGTVPRTARLAGQTRAAKPATGSQRSCDGGGVAAATTGPNGWMRMRIA